MRDGQDKRIVNKISYGILNRKVKISLTDLETADYQYFYICPLHNNGCLSKDLFAEILQKVSELWKDELTRDKKTFLVDAKRLKKTEDTMLNIIRKKNSTEPFSIVLNIEILEVHLKR